TVLPPSSDDVLFRCTNERCDWYLEKGLAVRVSHDPPVIRLTFKPKGPGHSGDPYFIQDFKNRCVVCGDTSSLSHHHIVPDGYRKYFPKDSRQHGRWMYDVLLLCVDCHETYERFAHELKKNISKEYDIDSSGVSTLTRDDVTVLRAAAALYRHGEKIPKPKRDEFESIMKAYLGKPTVSMEDCHLTWKKIKKSAMVTPAGLLIAQKIADIDDFAVRWRRHFVKFMKPKFLPELWDPERRIYSEPDQLVS